MTTRRSFIGGIASVLAAGFAPAAIGSGVLMPVRKIAMVDQTFLHDGTVYVIRGGELYRRIPGYQRYDGKPFRGVRKWDILASAQTVQVLPRTL